MNKTIDKLIICLGVLFSGGMEGICIDQVMYDDTIEVSWSNDFQLVEIKSAIDDHVQKAYFYRSTAADPAPLIVSLHTWSGDYSQEDPLSGLCRDKGLNYIHPDFRGINNTKNACCSDLAINDIDESISYAIENANVDTSRIYVIGTSGGGYATLSAFMKSKKRIRKFSAWVPISDLIAWYHESSIRQNKYAGDILGCTESKDSILNKIVARQKSPVYWDTPASKLDDTELHIYTGIYDGIQGSVPITHSINFYNKLLSDLEVEDSSKYVSAYEKLQLLEFRRPLADFGKIADRKIFLQKEYKNIKLVIFEGNHEMLPEYALDELCSENSDNNSIRPFTENPRYWQYKGSPVLLLGGSGDDNLFQYPGLEEHLDLLQSVGGNYIRNTMSSRDSVNYWPFYQQEDGYYDLEKWNEAYWNRFESLLKLTHERDIIVQIEVWDRFDFSRDSWKQNPFNPANNVNYTEEECGMEMDYPKHPARDEQPFFHSVPDMPRYTLELDVVRKYQENYVDKMLSYSLNYGNVLYCMNNETSTPPEWGKYWMKHIRERAGGKEIFTTDMFGFFYTPQTCKLCQDAIEDPEAYNYLDISQINLNFNQVHWDTLSWIIQQRELYSLRPGNCVKVYGGMNSTWGSGSEEDGIERFLRDVIGGCAAVRHHRPPYGNGLNVKSQASIQSIRKIETMVKMWEMEPQLELLSDREDDEAYLTAKGGEKFIILFPEGGNVTLDLTGSPGEFSGRWISIESGTWGEHFSLKGGSLVGIDSPGSGGWFAVITRK